MSGKRLSKENQRLSDEFLEAANQGCDIGLPDYRAENDRLKEINKELREACEDVLADFDEIRVTQASMNKMRRAVKKAAELQAAIARGK